MVSVFEDDKSVKFKPLEVKAAMAIHFWTALQA